jgi:hypothetical protein
VGVKKMKKSIASLVLLFLSLFIWGCVTTRIIPYETMVREPKPADYPMEVIDAASNTRTYIVIAVVEANAGKLHSVKDTLETIKKKARKLGGDALLDLINGPQAGGYITPAPILGRGSYVYGKPREIWSAKVIVWQSSGTSGSSLSSSSSTSSSNPSPEPKSSIYKSPTTISSRFAKYLLVEDVELISGYDGIQKTLESSVLHFYQQDGKEILRVNFYAKDRLKKYKSDSKYSPVDGIGELAYVGTLQLPMELVFAKSMLCVSIMTFPIEGLDMFLSPEHLKKVAKFIELRIPE